MSGILVSVVVITYNSAPYIIELLESVKKQTYRNIELVISDDGSTDKTIELVNEWLDKNKERFVQCRIVESDINTGITKNCNRGAGVATGDYIKFIAGDDLLLSNCIEDLLNYCIENNLKVVLSKALPFYENGSCPDEMTMHIQELFIEKFFEKTQIQQYRTLLTRFSIGQSLIGGLINRELFFCVGGFNEKYVMMEDYPFYVELSSLGYRLCLLNKYTVKYRVRAPELLGDFKKAKRYKLWLESLRMFEVDELLPRMKKERMFLAIYDLYVRRISLKIFSETNNRFFIILSKIIRYLSPLTIMDKVIASSYKAMLVFKRHKLRVYQGVNK